MRPPRRSGLQIDLAKRFIEGEHPRAPKGTDIGGQFIRLFRGEGSHDNPSYYPAGSNETGGWWTTDLKSAQQYAKSAKGKVFEIEVSEAEVEKRGLPKYRFIADPKVRERRREFIDISEPISFTPSKAQKNATPEMKQAVRDRLAQNPVDPKNIVDVYREATAEEVAKGENWYPSASLAVEALAAKYGVSRGVVAGLVAAYSPQKGWGQNLIEAAEVLRQGRPLGGKGNKDGLDGKGIMATAATKAQAAELLPTGYRPHGSFEDIAAPKRSKDDITKSAGQALKIRNFFKVVYRGDDEEAVVVDRHAYGIARGIPLTAFEYTTSTPGSDVLYNEAVAAYQEAAKMVSAELGRHVSPAQLQAITWLTRQRQNAARDTTRKTLGMQDWGNLTRYVNEYLPDIAEHILGQSGTGYTLSMMGVDIDLAAPYEEDIPEEPPVHEIQQPVENDLTVAQIAAILVAGYAAVKAVEMIYDLLKPWGIPLDAVQAAYNLAKGPAKPSAPKADRGILRFGPDGKLIEGGPTRSKPMIEVHDREAFFRAAYIANAAKRIARSLKDRSLKDAIEAERRYFDQHKAAQDQRVNAAAQVQTAANMWGRPTEFGVLVGWYLNPLLNNEAECKAANGHNFYAEHGTVIGWPGAVHANCGCYAGPPHPVDTLVDEGVRGVVRFSRKRLPAFKVKSRKA